MKMIRLVSPMLIHPLETQKGADVQENDRPLMEKVIGELP